MTIKLMNIEDNLRNQQPMLQEHPNGIMVRVDPRYPGAWSQLAPYLKEAIERDEGQDWIADDVCQLAALGQVQLWAMVNNGRIFGAMVTAEKQYSRRKVMEVLLLGTDPHTEQAWMQVWEQLKSMSKAIGCSCVTGTGRPGWARKLGADRTKTVWECDT